MQISILIQACKCNICLSDAPLDGVVEEDGVRHRTVAAKKDTFFNPQSFGEGELGKISGCRASALVLHSHS